ncbi:MAG: tetratricopeptide repeat protein [Bacteroidota bacterium]|nr:tetratricopeptide repeat protein [Bacteroidota bacterium]MDP4231066.1 tetratricopeptide repeat protein [Bacteroidota bacterium]MDP4235625.1 tetratricopeptide repeat protein [Bacteroidota bacterium]
MTKKANPTVQIKHIDRLLRNADEKLLQFKYSESEKLAADALSGKTSITEEQTSRALSIRGYCCLNTSRYDEAVLFFTDALEIAERISHITLQAMALNGMAMAQRNRVDYHIVLRYAKDALAFAEEAADKIEQRKALNTIGNVLGELKAEHSEALKYFDRSMKLAEEVGDMNSVAVSVSSMGIVYQNLGQYRQAFEHHSRALALAESVGNKEGMSRHLGNLGITYAALSDYERAMDFHTRSLAIAEAIGNKKSIAMSLGRLGNLYQDMDDPSRAIAYFKRSLAISEEFGHTTSIAVCLGNIGGAYRQLGDYQQAFEYLNRALELSLQIGALRPAGFWMHYIASIDHMLGNLEAAATGFLNTLLHRRNIVKSDEAVPSTLLALGKVLLQQGKMEEALGKFAEALRIAQESGEKKMAMEAHKEFAEVYSRSGEIANAFEHLQLYIAFHEEIYNEESRKNIERFNLRLAIAEKENETEILKLKAEHLEQEMKRQEHELSNKTLILVRQTDMLHKLRHDLDGIVRHAATAEKAVRSIREKLKEIPEHLLNWEKFSGEFRSVHPEFEKNLKVKYPSLSQAEVKVCCLLRIGMNTREISTLLFLSERTVELHRQHIRKKLAMPKKIDMHSVLAGI